MDNGWLATMLTTQIGFGGILGFLLGYGMKKIAAMLLKIVAVISALFMLCLTWLASIGIITVNYGAFASNLGGSYAGAMVAIASAFSFLAQALPIGGSFGLGFYIGAKKG